MSLVPRVTLRPARPGDAVDIAVLHHVSVHGHDVGTYPRAILERWAPSPGTTQAERLYREAERQGDIVIVAELHGALAGFGVVNPRSGVITACHVTPEFARHGVGRRLMSAMELTLLGAGRLTARVRASLAARRFYSTLGYRVTGRGEHVFADRTRMPLLALEKDLAATD